MLHLLMAMANAACPSSSGDVLLTLEQAEAAFQDLDVARFRIATDTLVTEVGCLAEQLPRDVIARVHRAEGLRAFVDGDRTRSANAFAAARAIEPGYRFPEALVPLDHPVHEQYTAVDPGSGGRVTLPAPVDGRITVDGRTEGVPESRPSVLQWVLSDGSVPRSVYRWPGDPPFEYPLAPTSAQVDPRPDPQPLRSAPSGRTSRGLALASGVVLATAGGLYAGAAVSRGQYFSDSATVEMLDPLRSRTNGLFWSSVGTASVGLGLGLSAVVVHRW